MTREEFLETQVKELQAELAYARKGSHFLSMMKASSKMEDAYKRLVRELWNGYVSRGDHNILRALGIEQPTRLGVTEAKALQEKVKLVLSDETQSAGILHLYPEYYGKHDPFFGTGSEDKKKP